jgi:DNA gyrase subunit B
MVSKKSTPKLKKEETYRAEDIYVLEGLEPVRRRPAMYIGDTGTEGLHHLIWECVDNSLTYQTPVIVREEKKIKILPIGELVDNLFAKNSDFVEKSIRGETEFLRKISPIETLSFDPQTLKLKFQPVFSLIRHKVNSEIFRVYLQNSRQIEITPYHSLFTLKDGRVLPIKGSEIKIGTPIVVPKIWPKINNKFKEIDLIDELLKLYPALTKNINLYNLSSILKENKNLAQKIKQKIPQWKSSKFGNLRHRANIWQDYLRYNYLPFNLIRELNKKEIKEIKKEALIGTSYNKKISLEPKLKINRYLVELLGIFAAKASIVKSYGTFYNRVVFSLGAKEKDLINYLCFLIEKVFKFKAKVRYSHETAKTVAIDSYLIALIFKEILKTGENSSKKRFPDLIFNLNQKLRERYLIGYLAGDGCPTKLFIQHLIKNSAPSQSERRKFSALTKNQQLAITLSYLLSSLNKTYCFERIFSKDNKKRKSKLKSAKQFFRIEFYWNTNSSYINYLPFDQVIKEVQVPSVNALRKNGQLGISQNKVLTLLKEKKLILKTEALKFINSDLGVLRVRKIEKIKYNRPFVYDISVSKGENFVAGFSPILAHNSLDEAMAGFCKNIEIVLLPENRVKTTDDGRGIPVEIHPQTKKSALETVMTTLHAGAKFGGKAYQVAGGLHGVGVSVVCALSKWMRVEVCRNNNLYCQEYSRGKPKTKVKKIGKCQKTGTTVIFEPDPEIFKGKIKFDLKKILNHLRQQAYLTKGVKIIVADEREEPKFNYTFYFEGGLLSYLKYLVSGANLRHPNIFYCLAEKDDILVEAAFQYTQEYETFEECFANNICTEEGGTHLTGFRTALTKTLNDYARKNNFLKETEENLTGEDVREGLTAVISVKLKEPQFEGQTKAKLGNPEAKTIVEQIISEKLAEFLEKNPQDARAIIENCILAHKARKAAKAARETVLRKGILEGLSLPGKLADCTSKNPEESELYIVEGESAGGSCKSARDRRFQAVLPLRGKILNVEKARLDKILASKEIKSLIIALGTAIAEDFNIEKIRYHRIVLTLDADSDGNHIRTLLLTLFYRYFKPIIERGYLYIAQPPLYKIQAGKEIEYAYTESDKAEILNSLRKKGKSAISLQRYKGLGEMNPEELWETTLNPENRVLLKVTIENAKEADRIFDILMGSEVLPRKKFIQAHAKKVKNLDI